MNIPPYYIVAFEMANCWEEPVLHFCHAIRTEHTLPSGYWLSRLILYPNSPENLKCNARHLQDIELHCFTAFGNKEAALFAIKSELQHAEPDDFLCELEKWHLIRISGLKRQRVSFQAKDLYTTKEIGNYNAVILKNTEMVNLNGIPFSSAQETIEFLNWKFKYDTYVPEVKIQCLDVLYDCIRDGASRVWKTKHAI